MKIHVALVSFCLLACEKTPPEAGAPPVATAPAGLAEGPAATADQAQAPAAAAASEQAAPAATTRLAFEAIAPCDFLNTEQVAGTLGVGRGDAVKAAPDGKDRGHRKRCRYTWQAEGGVEGSLVLDVAARREGPAGAQFDRAVEEHRAGLPVAGREGVTQQFTAVNGLGDEAMYSGNVSDMKALFARFGDRHLVSLQHAVVGADTGDMKAKLVALGRAVAKKLARTASP